jgi:hypothetical protein
MYALQVAQAGYLDYIDTGAGHLLRGPMLNTTAGKADITDFPLLDPGETIRGVANHMLVNARISIDACVLTQPEFHLRIFDDTEREVNEAWVEDGWINGNWSEDVKMTGMNVKANEVGFMVCGPQGETEDDMVVGWKNVDVLDMLFDRGYKSPGHWRAFCYRERVPFDDAVKRFGHIFNQDIAVNGAKERERLKEQYGIEIVNYQLPTEKLSDEDVEEEIKKLCVKRIDPLNSTWMNRATSITGAPPGESNINDYVLHVWHYWDKEHHVIFLASIDGNNSIPLAYTLMAGPDSPWNYQISTEAGPNPTGILPWAHWIGNWGALSMRPTPQAESVKPLSDMIRLIELWISKALLQSLPMLVASQSLSVEFRAQWKKAIASNEPMAIVEGDFVGKIEDLLSKIDLGTVQMGEWMNIRQMLKVELDAATGVPAPYRGQHYGGGEKTRREATDLKEMGGVQERDQHNQYGKFLAQVVRVSRVVGALSDTRPRTLMLSDGPVKINKGGFPVAQFLEKPCHVFIDPNDMIWQSQEERRASAIAFLHECEKGIEMGQLHPQRVWEEFLSQWGGKKFRRMMFTMKELQDNQKAKEQAAQGQTAEKESITASLKDMEAYPQLVQRWAERVKLLQPGEKLQPAVPTGKLLDHAMKVAENVHGSQHEQAMQSAEHAHAQQMEAMKPAPSPAGP